MADSTYPKIYRKQGAEELVIANGGSLNIETGGEITVDGTQISAIADVSTSGSATASGNATAINDVLAALRSSGLISSS